MADHAPERRCKASNARGEPCRATIVGADGYCPAHAGGGRDMRELGRRGGKARLRKREESASDRLERLTLVAIEQLLTAEGNATAKSAAARLVLDRVASSSSVNLDLAKRAVYAEQRALMEAEMPTVRAKLAILIERRARAIAESGSPDEGNRP